MLAATKVKMSGSKKKKTTTTTPTITTKTHTHTHKNTYDISSIKRITRNFLEFSLHIVVVQNNGQEMYKKSVLCVQSCFFAN